MPNNIFFISDTHFGHARALELFRPGHFKDVKEMDETMIENWNRVVAPRDVVWHLGDFSFGKVTYYRKRLNGQINLILGNHDRARRGDYAVFNTVKDYYRLKVGGIKVVLFHYPISRWDCSHYGSWHLYGHVHGQYTNRGRSKDVGAEMINYTPISFDELRPIMEAIPTGEDYGKDYLDDRGL